MLLDEQADDTYQTSKSYNVSGIPAKFVIDKEGRVRFAFKGFNGGDDATFEEVRNMVNTLLND